MSNAATLPPDQLDVVQHPILGTLKFPKSMPYADRNNIIGDLEVSPEGMQAKSRQQASAAVRRPVEQAVAPGQRAPGEAPTAVSRFAEATTGSPHPLDALTQGDIPAFVGAPGEYAKNLIGAAAKAPAELAYSAVMHPLDTAEQIMPVNRAIGDVREGRIGAGAGDIAGGLVNTLGLEKAAESTPAIAETAASGMNRIGVPSDTGGMFASPKRAQGLYEKGVAPGSLTAQDRSALNDEFRTAAPDLADEFRGRPTEGGQGGIVTAAERVRGAKNRVWQTGVEPEIENYAQVQRPTNDVAQAIRDTFTDFDRQTKPVVVAASENLASMFDRPMSVREMADKVTQLNNDKAVSRYYGLNPNDQAQAELADPSLRGKVSAVNALRDKLIQTIGEAGGDTAEGNFKQARERWGALNSVEDRLRNTRVPAPEGFLTRAANTVRAIYRPEYWASRETLMNLNNPERLIPKAMNMIGKTDLPTPPQVGRTEQFTPPSRMLGAAPLQIGASPDTSGPTDMGDVPIESTSRAERLGLLLPEAREPIVTPPTTGASSVTTVPAPSELQRGRGGQIGRVYSGETGPGLIGHTAEGGDILEPRFRDVTNRRMTSDEVREAVRIMNDPSAGAVEKMMARERLRKDEAGKP